MKYILTILLISLPALSFTQDSIKVSGVVKDKYLGEPLIGASVFANIGNKTIGTLTDIEGFFELTVPKNTPKIEVSYLGYRASAVPVSDIFLEIYLLEASLDEIIVTCNFKETLWVAPLAITNITLDNLNLNDETNIAPILNQISGVFMHSGALNTNRITIRGIGSRSLFSTTKIKAYFNNIPLTSGDGETTLEDIDLNIMDAITIIKGPTATVSGAGLGGAIFLEDKSNWHPTEKSIQTKFTVGSYGLIRSANHASINQERLRLNLFYNNTQSDGYRDNNEYNRANYTLLGRYDFDKASLSFIGSFIDLKAFIPSSLDSTDYADNPSAAAFTWAQAMGYEDYTKSLVGLNYSQNFKTDLRMRTSVFANTRNNYEVRPFNILNESSQSIGLRSILDYDFSGGSAYIGTELFRENYDWQTIENNDGIAGELLSDNTETRAYANIFTGGRYNLGDFMIVGGLNLNLTNYDYQDFFNPDSTNLSGDYSFQPILSPRLSVQYDNSRSSYYINVSHGFSPPSLEETLTPDGQINPNIQPERGWNFEMGTRGSIKNFDYDVALYSMQIKDLLVARRTAEDQFIGINAGQTTHNGIETDLKYSIFKNDTRIELFSTYTLSDYTFKEFIDDAADYSGNQLTGIPKHHLNTGITYKYNGLYSRLDYRYVSMMPMRDDNSIYSDAYNLVNFKMGYQWKSKQDKFEVEVFGGINNIFNEKYASMILVNAGSFGGRPPRYFYPGLPRHFYTGIVLKYIL